MNSSNRHRGFTLIELLLVVAIIGMIATIAMYSQRYSNEKRNDVRRATDINALQKGLSLYLAAANTYPVMTGCINGTDIVTAALRSKGLLNNDDSMVDPTSPSDLAKCYYYTSNGATYSLRYSLVADSSAGKAGTYTVTP